MTPLEIVGEEMAAPVNADMVIDELAIDSLEYIELLRRLEDVFSVRIDEEDLTGVETLGDLCKVVDRKRVIPAPLAQQSFNPVQAAGSLSEEERAELRRRAIASAPKTFL